MESGSTRQQQPLEDRGRALHEVTQDASGTTAGSTSLSQRIRTYLEITGYSQSTLAKLLGLPTRKLSYYLTEKSQDNLWPLLPLLLRHDTGLSREWLYFGEGNMHRSDAGSAEAGPAPAHEDPASPAVPVARGALSGSLSHQSRRFHRHEEGSSAPCPSGAAGPTGLAGLTGSTGSGTQAMHMGPGCGVPADKPLKLTGLGDGEVHGWRRVVHTAAHVTAPRLGEGWLAVLAAGDAMLPRGIREGYTVFCDGHLAPAAGEAVYVERQDGYGGIKVFAGLEHEQVLLEDWLPPDDTGRQSVRKLALDMHELRVLAPVIYVKHRL